MGYWPKGLKVTCLFNCLRCVVIKSWTMQSGKPRWFSEKHYLSFFYSSKAICINLKCRGHITPAAFRVLLQRSHVIKTSSCFLTSLCWKLPRSPNTHTQTLGGLTSYSVSQSSRIYKNMKNPVYKKKKSRLGRSTLVLPWANAERLTALMLLAHQWKLKCAQERLVLPLIIPAVAHVLKLCCWLEQGKESFSFSCIHCCLSFI